MKYMTFWEYCGKEIRNDDWREQIKSEKHFKNEKKAIVMFFNPNMILTKNHNVTMKKVINPLEDTITWKK